MILQICRLKAYPAQVEPSVGTCKFESGATDGFLISEIVLLLIRSSIFPTVSRPYCANAFWHHSNALFEPFVHLVDVNSAANSQSILFQFISEFIAVLMCIDCCTRWHVEFNFKILIERCTVSSFEHQSQKFAHTSLRAFYHTYLLHVKRQSVCNGVRYISAIFLW